MCTSQATRRIYFVYWPERPLKKNWPAVTEGSPLVRFAPLGYHPNGQRQLEHGRGREPRRSGYAARSQEAVYEAGLSALAASLRAIYQEGQRGNPAANGRLIPFNSNSPTGSTVTAFSTFVSTRGLIRICPGFASSHSREATLDTVPMAA
jgi:hypothetical protein